MCPVLDFCELNGHINACIAHADICVQKLREWQKKAPTCQCLSSEGLTYRCVCAPILVAITDLTLKEKKYCLICMGFGPDLAPSIMWAIVDAALSNDDTIWQATSAYIDNIFTNEDTVSSQSEATSGWLWAGKQGTGMTARSCVNI